MTTLLWAGAAGSWLFFVVFLIDGATRRGYESLRHPVSALALGARGWVQTTDFVVYGLHITVAAIAVSQTWSSPLLTVAVVVLGVGPTLSGVLPMDPMWGCPAGAPECAPKETSRTHRIHDNVGAMVLFSLPVVALLAAFVLEDPLWRWGSGSAGVITLVGSLVFEQAWEQESRYTGLLQRVTLIVGLGRLGALLAGGALNIP